MILERGLGYTGCFIIPALVRVLLPESQYLPWVMSTRVSADRMQLLIVPRSVLVTRTSSGPWHCHDTVSRQCHESARMSCCHESDRHLWCLLVSQHCILSLHLPTLTWYKKTRYSLLPFSPNIYIRMCVHQIPVIVSRENVCLDNCLFIYTLPFSC